MSAPEDQIRAQTQWQNRGAIAVEAFERFMVPATFRPWAIELLKLATLKPGDRVLDVACGTGIVARLAAEQVGASGSVVGVDISPAMLEAAKASATATGSAISWREGSASALPLLDASFDVVLCQHGLQFFAERLAALQEMRRVLVTGGRVGVAVWQSLDQNPGQEAMSRALMRWRDTAANAVAEAVFSLADAAALYGLFAAAGFEDVKIQSSRKASRFRSFDEFMAFPLASMNLDDGARTEVTREVAAALEAYVDADGIAVPMAAHIVTARA